MDSPLSEKIKGDLEFFNIITLFLIIPLFFGISFLFNTVRVAFAIDSIVQTNSGSTNTGFNLATPNFSSTRVSGSGSSASITLATTSITWASSTISGGNNGPKIAVDTNNLPRIFYYDSAGADSVKFLRCGTEICDSATTTAVATPVGMSSGDSFALTASTTDGFPRFVFRNATAGTLSFVQCTNGDCSTQVSSTIATVGTASAGTTGTFRASVVMGSDTYARIAYHNMTNGTLNFAKCNDDACSSPTISVIDHGGSVTYSEMNLGSDGYARIVYQLANSVRFALCTNSDCSGAGVSTTTVDANAGAVSMALRSNDLATIAHDTSSGLRVYECTNSACSTKNTSPSLDSDGNYNALVLGLDGYPKISYIVSNSLKFADCSTSNCSTAATSTINSVGTNLITSIARGPNGLIKIMNRNTTSASAIFSYQRNNYASSGTFTSGAIDVGSEVDAWNDLSWTNSGGASTTITMKARSAASIDMSGATDWASCTNITSGGALSTGGCVTVGHQYIQYQASLSTTDVFYTPSLDDVTLSYSPGGSDIIAPTIPTGVTVATATSTTALAISWTASTDAVGVTGYNVYRDSVLLGTTDTNSYYNSSLSHDTLYSYTVSAYDLAGNTSSQSSAGTGTTLSDRAYISSIGGEFDAGSTITLTGYNFGTKSPAKPMVWADFDDGATTTSPLGTISAFSTVPADYTTLEQDTNSSGAIRGETESHENLGGNVGVSLDLQDSDPNYPGVSKVYVFHKRKYDHANYWTNQNHLTGTSSGSNTSTTLNDTTANWGVSSDYEGNTIQITGGTGAGQTRTIDTTHTATTMPVTVAWDVIPDETSTYDITVATNYKFFRLWPKPKGFIDTAPYNDDNRPDTIYTHTTTNPRINVSVEYGTADICHGVGAGGSYYEFENLGVVSWPPPAQTWTTEEYYTTMGDDTGIAQMWRDGVLLFHFTNVATWNPNCDVSPYDEEEWHLISLENFISRAYPPAGSYVYMDDIYIDNTASRVVLGNANTLAASTHREIQIPQTWSDTSLTFVANPGTFADGATAYLYVVDAAGNASYSGFPITIGSSPTAPICSLTPTPSTITEGDASSLAWTTTDATTLTINNSVGSATPVASGSTSVSPTTTTTYTGTVSGAGGSDTCTATITVNPVDGGDEEEETPRTGGGGIGPSCSLTISPTTGTLGTPATLSWSGYAIRSVTIDNAIGAKASPGSTTVSPTTPGTHVYTGTFTTTAGKTLTCSAILQVTGEGTRASSTTTPTSPQTQLATTTTETVPGTKNTPPDIIITQSSASSANRVQALLRNLIFLGIDPETLRAMSELLNRTSSGVQTLGF